MDTENSNGQQNCPRVAERGQTLVFVLLILSFFLLAAIGFAVDFANVWFHRQLAQSAADSACTAAVMDMLTQAQSGAAGGFTKGTSFDCATTPTAAPCSYAALNGYSGTGLVAGSPSNSVWFTFPASLPGVPPSCAGTPPLPTCSGASFTTDPYIQVHVVERLKLFFSAIISGSRTTDIGARAGCGLVLSNSPIPILVLNPTLNGALSVNGSIVLKIVGGPQKGIQVNSSSSTAVGVAGASGSIDLRLGGPNATGSDFGVAGSEPQVGIFQGGTTGNWLSPSGKISDPFALVPVPTQPLLPGVVTYGVTGAAATAFGCPDPAGGCDHYAPGYYASGIEVKKNKPAGSGASGYAVFDPGIYYLGDNLKADAQSCMRPSTLPGDGSGGAMFYFSGNATLNVGANSGSLSNCQTTLVPLSQVQCITSGPGTTILPAGVIAAGGLTGNVMLGPCQAPTAGGTNYGDPLGVNDPLGMQRGMLFFQDRSSNLAAFSNQPQWQGGGAFGLAGFMYFHYCNSANGAGLGTNCNSGAYTDLLSLQGNPTSGTFVIGETIVDRLSVGGNGTLEMDLNPGALFYVLKASLIQ